MEEYLQLFQNDTLSVGSTTKGLDFVLDAQGALLVRLVGPAVHPAGRLKLARGMETSRLALAYTPWLVYAHKMDGWKDDRRVITGVWTYPLLIMDLTPW